MEGKISLDDTSITAGNGGKKDFSNNPIRRIKMKTGEKIRITFQSDEVVSRNRHYKKDTGYRRCLAYTGFCPACLAADKNSQYFSKEVGRASSAFGANVFVYSTNQAGTELQAGSIGNVHLFVFGNEKFAALREIKQMYGSLVGIDLLVTCTDESFQKMTITPFPEKVCFLNQPNVKEYVDKAFKNDSYPLEKMICKEVNAAQMVKDFGLSEGILSMPEAKSFIDVATTVQNQQTTQPVDSKPQQEVQPQQEVKVVSTSSLLDEL